MFFLIVNFNNLKSQNYKAKRLLTRLLTLNNMETNKINKKRKMNLKSHDMLPIDQLFKCQYSSSIFSFIVNF